MSTTLIPHSGVGEEHRALFMSKVEVTEGGCWKWKAGCFDSGYGQFHVSGVSSPKRAHRVSYELHVGDIGGLQLDHMCHDPKTCRPERAEDCPHRKCVNPDHLRPSTNRENTLRGNAPTAVNAAKTECVHGHPLSGDNLGINNRGERVCRRCAVAATQRWLARRRQALAA